MAARRLELEKAEGEEDVEGVGEVAVAAFWPLSQPRPPRWSPAVETAINWYRHSSKHPRLTHTVTHARTASQRDATPTIFQRTRFLGMSELKEGRPPRDQSPLHSFPPVYGRSLARGGGAHERNQGRS